MVEAQELRRLYWDEGKDLVTLGALYDRSPGTVWGWMRKYGIPTRSTKEAAALKTCAVTPDEQARMVRLYQEGFSSNDIGKELGRGGRMVRTHLERLGVLRERGEAVRLAVENGKICTTGRTMRREFFDEWAPEMAWVLGLIFGDGHVFVHPKVGNYGIILAGTREVCEKVAALINPALLPVKDKESNCWLLTWYSRQMVQQLRAFGLFGGNKARSIRLPSTPEPLLGHFLRGFWDADGHWRRVGRSVTTDLTSASEGMVNDLQRLLGGRRNSGWTVLHGKHFRRHCLSLRVGETRSFIRLVYGSSEDRMRCSRKYALATVGVGEIEVAHVS